MDSSRHELAPALVIDESTTSLILPTEDDEFASTLVTDDESSTSYTSQTIWSSPDLTGQPTEMLRKLRYFVDVVAPLYVAVDAECYPNPWKQLVHVLDYYPMLRAAVEALSVWHYMRYNRLDGQEWHDAELKVRSLRDECYRLFYPNLNAGSSHETFATTFVLILLAAATSGSNYYRVHLQDYAGLLDDFGGTLAMAGSNRLKAQTAVLVRFDITLALVNKKGCCIPIVYLEALANCSEDPWEFFTMTGCFYHHMRIAYEMCNLVAQAQYEASATVKQSAVILEDRLQHLERSPSDTYDYIRRFDDGQRAEEIDQDRRSKMLVGFEIWSNTLKYYSKRVLRCLESSDPLVVEPRDQVLASIEKFSLHAHPEDMYTNKYLLPVLLVATDVDEIERRDIALRYIFTWRDRVILPHWDSRVLLSMWQRRDAYPELDRHLISFCDGADHMFV